MSMRIGEASGQRRHKVVVLYYILCLGVGGLYYLYEYGVRSGEVGGYPSYVFDAFMVVSEDTARCINSKIMRPCSPVGFMSC